MFREYLQERYTAKDFAPLSLEQVASNFEEIYSQMGSSVLKTEAGFATYALKGDALLIYDLYVKPEYRMKRSARQIFDGLLKAAEQANKSVVITFSEFNGKNKEAGLGAIQSVNFQPCHKLKTAQMFIRGI